MKFLGGLFEEYRQYHLHGPLILRYAGIVGAVGYPLFYLLRFTKPAQPFDDFWIRLAATLLCALLVVKDRWPQRLKPYYIAFSYPALVFSLPTMLIFTSLKNGGGPAAVGNTLVVAFFLILITDWRNTIVMLVLGIAAGVSMYFALDPQPRIPTEYIARLPLLILVVIGGSFFKAAGNRAAAEKMRSGYASIAGSIAHEMRNPLGQIKHSLERIQLALPEPTTSNRARTLAPHEVDALYRHVAESELAVNRGLQVIAMTLDQVSEKPMNTAAFSYVTAAEATYKAVREYCYRSDAEYRQVSVHVVEDFTFRGDETAYLFVLFNLLKNALYYMALRPQGVVTITIERLQVTVHDTGPGISPHRLARLFEPFRSAGKTEGTGLGLAYCQRVMRGFGGDIACHSEEGKYTEFVLRFPPVSEQDNETHRLEVLDRARAAFAGKRLLIVDDDAALRMTTRHKLQALGVEIDEAADGQRALRMLAANRYDVILLDLNMPVLDGYAVAEKIRRGRASANRDVRIVAHTSEAAHLACVKTQKAGMDGFVSKPCPQLTLVQALQQALARPEARVDADATLLAGRRILVADDNPYNRKAVAAYLQHAGASVVQVPHGPAVLAELPAAAGWDAILMDINMPGMSGVETTQAIRASGMAWRNIPIIALTAHSDPDIVQAARAAGMNDFLTKPVEADVLYGKVLQLVQGGISRHGAPVVPSTRDEGAAVPGGAVLNLERLESFRRIGMLEELLEDYIPEIARLLHRLEISAAGRDLQATLDALHSLLGMSGEGGAQALHALVRAIYGPMVETRAWPRDARWLAQIKTAAAEAEQALRAYGDIQTTVISG